MSSPTDLVTPRHRHLKWPALDPLERGLMVLCGITLFFFTTSTVCDVATRLSGHPWLWLQEVTSTFFIYGIFIGTAVATRRSDHLYLTALSESLHGSTRTIVEVINRLVIVVVGLFMVVYGYENFLRGFSSFRMPSYTPIASLYAAIPLSGALIVLFGLEQIINGLKNGFDHPDVEVDIAGAAALAEAFEQYETGRSPK
jgi:TRAP-type C4-dicarboxylate transport system permease small subunit